MPRKFNILHGELEDEDEQYRRPGYAKRNVRVGDAIGGDLIGGTIYELEAGERVCPYHYHHGVEEWLYVIAGEPTLRQPDGFRMPAEWAPHERTIMAGRAGASCGAISSATPRPTTRPPRTPSRRSSRFDDGLCRRADGAAEARTALTGDVEIVELAIDDSWLRNSAIFVLDGEGRRAGVHFRFNSWGEKFTPYDGDAAVGGQLIDRLGDRRYEAPFVLEGGSVAVDGEGTLLTTDQCLLHPNRNPAMTREEIEQGLRDFLGAEQVVWLGQGLAEDKDTDGHVDLVAAFTRPARSPAEHAAGHPSHEHLAANRSRLPAAGLDVVDFPILPTLEVIGQRPG